MHVRCFLVSACVRCYLDVRVAMGHVCSIHVHMRVCKYVNVCVAMVDSCPLCVHMRVYIRAYVRRSDTCVCVLLASQAGWEPDLVLASNSKRTKLTLNEMTTVMESLEAVDTHLMGWVYY